MLGAARACLEAGATPILIHHTTKAGGSRLRMNEPLELEDLAYSGFAEFARQWVLINRREPFEPGTGVHRLWVKAGGSAGQNVLFGLDVEEGVLGEHFEGRRWVLTVHRQDQLKALLAAKKSLARTEKQAEKMKELKEQILEILLRKKEPETLSALAASLGHSRPTCGKALAELHEEGRIISA